MREPDDGTVVYLHGGELVARDEVVTGEVVPDTGEPARETYGTRLVSDEQRQRMASAALELSHRTAPIAKAGGRSAIRHASYVVSGAAVVARRMRDSHTNSRYERIIRAAELDGNWERIADWEARAVAERQRRHQRAMDWLEAPAKLAKAMAIAAASVTALLLALGVVLAISGGDPTLIVAPIGAVVDAVRWVIWAFTVAWGPLLLAAPWLLLGWLWHVGRGSGHTPAWLQDAAIDGSAVVIDERAIAQALAHLGIGPIDRFFKDGGILSYTRIPARDGLGVAAQVRLPVGVTAAEVIGRKTRLAANLGRAGIEVWPSTGADEGLLDLWVADRGALDTGAGPWPWLEVTDPIDAYKGIPVGVTLRGDQVIAPINGTSWLIGGRPGQGKTTFGRLLVMGACLDPTAEIWVHVLADNPDFDPLAERFTRYHVGIGHDVAAAALQAFHDLMAEIEHRGQVMRAKGAPTAAKAGMPPLVAYFDEIHRLFQHRVHGPDAALVAEDVIKQARKYGVVVILVTQSPTATSIPKPVTRETICRVAFSVIDQIANDALLGDGKHRQGIRATELRPGSDTSPGDRGKALTVGVVPDVDWSMVIGHRVAGAEVNLIGERAMALLAAADREVPTDSVPDDAEERDLLEDLAEVMGTDPMPAAKVPALLMRAYPRWAPYRTLDGKRLRATLLEGYGIKVPSTQNRWPVDPAVIRRRLAELATEDLDA